MKIIPKGQNGLVVKSDNTKVVQRPVIFPIKYKIKPGETFVTDRDTGKKVLIRQKNETVSANRKSTYQEQQDQKSSPFGQRPVRKSLAQLPRFAARFLQ